MWKTLYCIWAAAVCLADDSSSDVSSVAASQHPPFMHGVLLELYEAYDDEDLQETAEILNQLDSDYLALFETHPDFRQEVENAKSRCLRMHERIRQNQTQICELLTKREQERLSPEEIKQAVVQILKQFKRVNVVKDILRLDFV